MNGSISNVWGFAFYITVCPSERRIMSNLKIQTLVLSFLPIAPKSLQDVDGLQILMYF